MNYLEAFVILFIFNLGELFIGLLGVIFIGFFFGDFAGFAAISLLITAFIAEVVSCAKDIKEEKNTQNA